MFRLDHTQNDWTGSMFPRQGNRLYRHCRKEDISRMIQTGKQVTQ